MNLNTISYKRKNQLLLLFAFVALIFSWQFAIKNTFDELSIHQQLNQQSNLNSNLSYNPRYMVEKANLLSQLTLLYTQDSTDWKNHFWLNVSSKVANKANIIYQADAQTITTDTATSIAREKISFMGNFKNLVLVVDTLQKTKNLGFLTSVQLVTPKSYTNSTVMQIQMQTIFSILKK